MISVDLLHLALFVGSLGLAAFFCAAETAFIGLQKVRLRNLVDRKHPAAMRVIKIVEHPERFLSTVLLGVNFFETAAAVLGTLMAVKLWGESQGAAIAAVLITVLTLVFVEIIPKSIAARSGETVALVLSRPIEIVSVAFYPFVYVLSRLALRVTRLGGVTRDRPTLSEAEILTAISMGEAEGIVEETAAEMIQKVFEFGDRMVREIMTPRIEIAWIELGTTVDGFYDVYRKYPHTRFPVYKDKIENVVGILSIKDLLMARASDLVKSNDVINSLVRPAFLIPETKHMGELLGEMQDNNYHLALVVDEFGSIAGLITIEQLIGEIVGSIGDELAGAGKAFVTIGENTFEVDGGLRVEEAGALLGAELPLGDYETMAGFVLYHLGHIPKQGEHLTYKNLKLRVTEMKGMKIEKILIIREGNAAVTSGV